MRTGTVLLGALALLVSGCAAPEYTYVGDSDSDLVLRVPRSWEEMDTDEVLESFGLDPGAFTGWAAFYDAATDPDPVHAQLESTEAPVLLVRTVEVPEDERDGLNPAGLREQVLPADAAAREAATKAGTFRLITDETIDDERGAGAHVVYAKKLPTGLEYVDQIALTDPGHTLVSLVHVHCNERCYRERAGEITEAVTSLTLKNL